MDQESWTQLNRLLDEAIDLPPEGLESWLASLGQGDEPLKARVRALLGYRSSVQASCFLESGPSLNLSSLSNAGGVDVGLLSPSRMAIAMEPSSAPIGCCGVSGKAEWARCGWPSGPTACCSARSR